LMFKVLFGFAVLLASPAQPALLWGGKTHEPATAQVTVRGRAPGCAVDLDGQSAGKTDGKGLLVLREVAPGDHYLHIRCPGEEEKSSLISPGSGENLALDMNRPAGSSVNPSPGSAGATLELRQLVQQAVQLRNRSKLDEAVVCLRKALVLDPGNSDLHLELGTTFLLSKDWKRARIEMLEAIRNDPTNANAHNGLGFALEKMGNLDGALQHYRMATQLEPDDATYRTRYLDTLAKSADQKAKKK